MLSRSELTTMLPHCSIATLAIVLFCMTGWHRMIRTCIGKVYRKATSNACVLAFSIKEFDLKMYRTGFADRGL